MMSNRTDINESDAKGDRLNPTSLNLAAYLLLVLFAFAVAFSLPAGRILLSGSVLLLAVDYIISRRLPRLPRTAWIGLLFLLLLGISTVTSDRFVLSETKLDKLIWFVSLPTAALLVTSLWRLKGVLVGYASGAVVLVIKTIYDSIRLCAGAAEQVRDGLTDYKTVLINGGSMTDGQRFMLGIVIVVALMFLQRKARGLSFLGWGVTLVMQVLGLVLTFKRGALICTAFMLVLFASFKAGWKQLLVLLVVVTGIVLLPPVRSRLSGLRDEFSDAKGGRLLMWTKIAPELVKEYPLMGRGYRLLANDDMVKIARNVERDRDHLHSNPLQILVDGGIVGLLLYLSWMISSFFDAGVFILRSNKSVLSLVPALMFAGLFLHGLVEYNFGDSELVLLYGLAMGCCASGAAIFSEKSTDQSADFVPER